MKTIEMNDGEVKVTYRYIDKDGNEMFSKTRVHHVSQIARNAQFYAATEDGCEKVEYIYYPEEVVGTSEQSDGTSRFLCEFIGRRKDGVFIISVKVFVKAEEIQDIRQGYLVRWKEDYPELEFVDVVIA